MDHGSAHSDLGATLAGYRIEALLGRGGMAVVYLAEDLALGRRVALKLLAPQLSDDAAFRERFRLESRLAASIDHPNVIPIFEAAEAEGQLYIAMRYVEGTDLKRLLADEAVLAPERAVELIGQVAAGLDAAHARGLVHRDVKSSNVLIAEGDGTEHAYLADFGLTKPAASPEEARESLKLSGSIDYVSPEQIAGRTSGTGADIYSLGCVLYEALTGSVPYPRESEAGTLLAHVEEPPPRPSELRPDLGRSIDGVIARAMAKDPELRFESGRELVAAARDALPQTRTSRGRKRIALLAALGALVVAAALAGTLLLAADGPVRRPEIEPTVELTAGALQRIDTRTNELEATIRLDGEPVDVAVGTVGIWLADVGRQTVTRIDPKTNEVVGRSELAATPLALATTPGASPMWLAGHGPNGEGVLMELGEDGASKTEIDLRALAFGASASTAAPVSAVAAVAADPAADPAGGFAGWVADVADGSLRYLSPERSGHRVAEIDTGGAPHALAAQDGFVWVGQDDELLKIEIDRSAGSARVTTRTSLSGRPVALAPSTSDIWVASQDGRLSRLALSGELVRTVDTGAVPVDLARAAGSLWLLRADGTLARLDPGSGEVEATIEVGGNPVSLAVSDDDVWVAVRGGDRLRRSALPSTYRSYLGGPLSVPGECKEGRLNDCLISFTVHMRAGDGTNAVFQGAWRERRVRGGSVECEGKTHEGPAISDVEDAGRGRLRITRWGTVALRFERFVVVAEGPSVEFRPICGAGAGRWLGISGALKGESGRFEWYGPEDERIILR